MDKKFLTGILEGIKEKSGVQQLSSREKIVLTSGTVILLSLVFFHFVLSPYFQARKHLTQSILRKESELVEMKLLQLEYESLKKHEGGVKVLLAARAADFSLFAFLDRQAQLAEIKENIKYMKPSLVEKDSGFDESLVEMKLEDTTLEKVVNFLELIESKEQIVSIKRISIQKDVKKQGYLDVLLQIVTFMEKK